MRDFMRHHAGQFGLRIRLQDQPGVDEEKSARQRECVDVFRVDHLDGERHLGVGVAHQVLPDAVHVLGDNRVVDDLGLPLHLLRQPFAERNLFFKRIEVYALTHVPVADRIGILVLIVRECRDGQEANKRAAEPN